MASRHVARRSLEVALRGARGPTLRQAPTLLRAEPVASLATSAVGKPDSNWASGRTVREAFQLPFDSASQQRRGFAITATSALVQLPDVSDPAALKALKELLAATWVPLDESLLVTVDKAIGSTSDPIARDALKAGRAAAAAVDSFGERLELLRLDLDELSGGKFGGERVASIPPGMRAALASALSRYSQYLASFEAAEGWLQRKAKEELGGVLLTLKQRCSGLETEWNKISLLGTSGLTGSYIEQREATHH
eukprot:TRINITY_DN17185_c0_g1_i1.p1 TRINITY_DN17185_c0_g1~~TRINITY_DN17185_c0_g1_i1.p1  ORF type:complete len:252 (-),score=7.73 TRINITY_DN17185_c0_g1_i1:163-918(-)